MEEKMKTKVGASTPFLWGAATSAYQIEGAAEGRGESIWDRFSGRPGAILDGSRATTACDHLTRFREDVALLSDLGLNAYRFSVSWPRIQPDGTARSKNPPGLAFYDRLLDELLSHKITPLLTLYHWELPQFLEDRGGWKNRDTALRFQEFTSVVARALSDRVHHWITINEPRVVVELGYRDGIHAPGFQEKPGVLHQVAHHLLLAHGLALSTVRQESRAPVRIGLADNPAITIPYTSSAEDTASAEVAWREENALWLGPLFRGQYPEGQQANISPGDMKTISTPMDFLGLNVYHGVRVRATPLGGETVPFQPGFPLTTMGWPVVPECVYHGLMALHKEYRPLSILISETGCAFPDRLDERGQVHDPERLAFLHSYLEQAFRAKKDGVPLDGIFVWSLMDNFEWERGLTQRFGLVYVDYPTQRRIQKSSARWLRNYIGGHHG